MCPTITPVPLLAGVLRTRVSWILAAVAGCLGEGALVLIGRGTKDLVNHARRAATVQPCIYGTPHLETIETCVDARPNTHSLHWMSSSTDNRSTYDASSGVRRASKAFATAAGALTARAPALAAAVPLLHHQLHRQSLIATLGRVINHRFPRRVLISARRNASPPITQPPAGPPRGHPSSLRFLSRSSPQISIPLHPYRSRRRTHPQMGSTGSDGLSTLGMKASQSQLPRELPPSEYRIDSSLTSSPVSLDLDLGLDSNSDSSTVDSPAAAQRRTVQRANPGPRPRDAGAPLRRERSTRETVRRRRFRGPKPTMGSWWVDSRIEATVTRAFVLSHLLADEIERLDRPVAFGAEDLTERTYLDSIRHDAPRLFLILVDLGVPDQIFGVIDDGWDDAELPIALEDVDRLQLTPARDDKIERKFYHRQFYYLLKTIDRGLHQTYVDRDVVPVDVIDRPGLTPHKTHVVDKVKLPNAPDVVFCRRRYPLGNGPGCIPPQDFLDAIQGIRDIQSVHMVSYWASYTHNGCGYVLFTPFSDFNLKSFLATTPSSYKNLPKKSRRELIINWILCLVDTMCFLHSRNRSHCFIKPSSIFFNSQNHIFYSDSTRLTPDGLASQADKSSFDREWYDYAAPEQWFRPGGPSSPPNRMSTFASASTSPDNGNFSIVRGGELSNSPNAMLLTPNPQLSPKQAEIFSLGCVILELLSFLVKRSTSKFKAFRSAKHKTAGRGGAVLDTSFHRNLGQVEAWMSNLAKDATRKVPDADGGNAFRGVTPMLHVVTSMLAANPHERPPAVEVQQRIYQIVTEVCGIQEPHCVHQYSDELDYSLGRMHIQPNPNSDPAGPRRAHRTSVGYGTPRTFHHSRQSSSGGYSQTSRMTGSSEGLEAEAGFSSASRGPSSPQRSRAPSSWSRDAPYQGSPSLNQPSLFTTGS
ncbi:hypothetical protein G7046_g8807 [Stylonectria norvegica]|nr:hypothetical protein G7046_g8807 [Stylonectria norvegica]